jgi:hypothetical protein
LNLFDWVLKPLSALGFRDLSHQSFTTQLFCMTPFFKRILFTTLIAGSLDLVCAYTEIYIRSGSFPSKMFQVIAGGALGLKNTIHGGFPIILLGIFIHYFIVFCWTLVFFLLYGKNKIFGLNKYIAAIIYGYIIWLVMNMLVLRLSALGASPFVWLDFWMDGFLLGITIGLPVSLSASGFYGERRPHMA